MESRDLGLGLDGLLVRHFQVTADIGRGGMVLVEVSRGDVLKAYLTIGIFGIFVFKCNVWYLRLFLNFLLRVLKNLGWLLF